MDVVHNLISLCDFYQASKAQNSFDQSKIEIITTQTNAMYKFLDNQLRMDLDLNTKPVIELLKSEQFPKETIWIGDQFISPLLLVESLDSDFIPYLSRIPPHLLKFKKLLFLLGAKDKMSEEEYFEVYMKIYATYREKGIVTLQEADIKVCLKLLNEIGKTPRYKNDPRLVVLSQSNTLLPRDKIIYNNMQDWYVLRILLILIIIIL